MCSASLREEALGWASPEIPEPLLLGFLERRRAGVGGGWKRSCAHLPPRQRPRAGGWRALRPRRCTRSCGSRSAGACSGLGATVGEGRDTELTSQRVEAAMTVPFEPGPWSAGPGKDREQLGGSRPAAADALAHPWDPAQDATIPNTFRTKRATTNIHAGTTGANPKCPGHAGSQATSSLPGLGTLITGVPGSQHLPIPLPSLSPG